MWHLPERIRKRGRVSEVCDQPVVTRMGIQHREKGIPEPMCERCSKNSGGGVHKMTCQRRTT
jgi:hypothetical protein